MFRCNVTVKLQENYRRKLNLPNIEQATPASNYETETHCCRIACAVLYALLTHFPSQTCT